MANLRQVSEEDLKAELERREKEKAAGPRPKPLAKPDFSAVLAMFETQLAEMEKGEVHDDDYSEFQHYVFENVAKAIYGDKYFQWTNKVL